LAPRKALHRPMIGKNCHKRFQANVYAKPLPCFKTHLLPSDNSF